MMTGERQTMADKKGVDKKGEHRKPHRGIMRMLANHRGAMAVEFAIVAPIFLIMVLGIIEVGRAFWIKSTLQYAVEEAGRYVMVNTSATTSQVQTYAQGYLPSSLSAASVSALQETTGSVTFMSITASYSFQTIVPLVPLPAVTLNAKSRVPIAFP